MGGMRALGLAILLCAAACAKKPAARAPAAPAASDTKEAPGAATDTAPAPAAQPPAPPKASGDPCSGGERK
jgi:hypothetical protein